MSDTAAPTARPTTAEIQSNFSRVKWAEGLICQLPPNHEGRNSWLLNYGRSDEAKALQEARSLVWNEATQSAVPIEGHGVPL